MEIGTWLQGVWASGKGKSGGGKTECRPFLEAWLWREEGTRRDSGGSYRLLSRRVFLTHRGRQCLWGALSYTYIRRTSDAGHLTILPHGFSLYPMVDLWTSVSNSMYMVLLKSLCSHFISWTPQGQTSCLILPVLCVFYKFTEKEGKEEGREGRIKELPLAMSYANYLSWMKFLPTVWGRSYDYPHFTAEETEAII